jgi:4-hydroxy-tetrahydrodipicolinate reductase
MKKISIIGASGKTGSKILEALLKNKNLNSFVQFAIVSEKSNFLNQDVFSHLKIQNENNKALSFSCNIETALRNSDIIIDFSSHKLSEAMIENYFEKLELSSKKFIIGTTPFEYKKLKKFDEFIEKNLLFYSPNMSILIGILAGFLEKYSDFFSQNYDIGINEIHHVHKKDSPSGTAKLLVNKLQKNQAHPAIL